VITVQQTVVSIVKLEGRSSSEQSRYFSLHSSSMDVIDVTDYRGMACPSRRSGADVVFLIRRCNVATNVGTVEADSTISYLA
jgi:hypothetical protein